MTRGPLFSLCFCPCPNLGFSLVFPSENQNGDCIEYIFQESQSWTISFNNKHLQNNVNTNPFKILMPTASLHCALKDYQIFTFNES